jgi:hypothetical protein
MGTLERVLPGTVFMGGNKPPRITIDGVCDYKP